MTPIPPKSLSSQQARFVRELAEGKHKSAKDAAIAAGYAPSGACSNATKTMARPDAQAYHDELTRAITDEVVQQASMSKLDVVEFLFSILRAKPSEASPNNPLCDIHPTPEGEIYVFPKKLEAVRLALNELSRTDESGAKGLGDAIEAILNKKDV